MALSQSTISDSTGSDTPNKEIEHLSDSTAKATLTPPFTDTHGDPIRIPLQPTNPSDQSDAQHAIATIPGIKEVRLQSSAYQHGPLEAIYSIEDENTESEMKDRLEDRINTRLPDSQYGIVVDHPTGRQLTMKPEEIAGAVHIYEHPLKNHATAAIDHLGLKQHTTLSWDPDPSHLKDDPLHMAWDRISNLQIDIDKDVDTSELEKLFTQTAEIPVPSTYTLNVTTSNPSSGPTTENQTLSDLNNSTSSDTSRTKDSEATIEANYDSSRPISNIEPQSGIYQQEAEKLGEAIAEFTSRYSPKVLSSREDSSNRKVPNGVQLTITSPPYLDAINYLAFNNNKTVDYTGQDGSSVRNGSQCATTDELVDAWKKQHKEIFEQVYDVTHEGGFCAVVIGTVKAEDGKWVDLPSHLSTVMSEIGWNFHEKITWRKVGSGSQRFGTTIQNPDPTYYYPNQTTESIFIYRKGDMVRRKNPEEKLSMSEIPRKLLKDNVWDISPVPHNANVNHPCPYPGELVHRLTVLYSHQGDIVLDPMAGSGTTVKVADTLDRIAIGTEIQGNFVNEARRRLYKESYERADQIYPEWESVDGDSESAKLTITPDESPSDSSRANQDQDQDNRNQTLGDYM